MESGLVAVLEEGDRRLYRITPQGLDALRKLRAAKEVLSVQVTGSSV